MAHKECRDIDEWIVEEVVRPVEVWEKHQKEVCKEMKCNWWMLCLNKLFCYLVYYLVLVIHYVVEYVGRWITRTVCEVVASVFDLFVNVLMGIAKVLGGLLTLNFGMLLDGLIQVGGGVIEYLLTIVRIGLLGDTIAFIVEEVNKKRLRDHVRTLLERRYAGQPETLQRIKDAIGLDYGEFGLRLRGRPVRTYVRSDFRSVPSGPPDLIAWHENKTRGIDIRKLAGYEYDEYWRRHRPEVVVEGAGVPAYPAELAVDSYIKTSGGGEKAFRIYCMTKWVMETKLNQASKHGRTLGLLFRWSDIEDVQVSEAKYVIQDETGAALVDFLVRVLGRKRESLDAIGAPEEQCVVAVAGVFGYTNKLNGIAACLRGSRCQAVHDASGATYRDREPDIVWKYVPIHEIGHYFGLCHADGLDRIMYTGAKEEDKSPWSWWLLPKFFYLYGEPTFTFGEATQTWDYIVANFPTSCLTTRAE